jgi:putative phosphoesterase
MLIAIISDIHDNLVNLNICLNWCKTNGVTKIIFCGDTTTLETIKNLARFNGEIFIVRGNIELFEASELKKFPNLTYYGEIGILDLGGLRLGLVHEPKKILLLLKSADPQPDYIFYGHTHQPWLEQRQGLKIVNPGNLAGTFYQATFATLDTVSRKLELKILAQL